MKVQFRYSFIYEMLHHKGEFDFRSVEQETKDFILSLEKYYRPLENKIIAYLEEITSLHFKSKKINCYVVNTSSHMPLSDPLTLAIHLSTEEGTFTLSKERYVDMLIHELIHNLLLENEEETKEYSKVLFSGLYDKNWNVAIHVLLHSIHKKIFDKFFDKRRLKEEREAASFYPEYKTAWEIVDREGSDAIIETLKKFSSKG